MVERNCASGVSGDDDFDHLPGSRRRHQELVGRPYPADAIPLLLGCTISSYKWPIFNRECINFNIWKWEQE
jgi:hypothetical protein